MESTMMTFAIVGWAIALYYFLKARFYNWRVRKIRERLRDF